MPAGSRVVIRLNRVVPEYVGLLSIISNVHLHFANIWIVDDFRILSRFAHDVLHDPQQLYSWGSRLFGPNSLYTLLKQELRNPDQ
jgi:hypothetical protein